MKLEKIPLKNFIDTLIALYNKGVDYVDIVKKKDTNGQPAVFINFTKEYMNPSLLSEEEDTSPIEGQDINDLT